MATYYVDPAGSNTAPYDTWANAATSLQTAVSACSGTGNIIYARGTQTLTGSIDFASAASGALGFYNKIIGCNASGDNDGTYFVLDGNNSNGASAAGIWSSNRTFWWLENIHVTRCLGDGVGGSNSYANSWVFVNCKSSSNGGVGFNGNSAASTSRILYKCISLNNGGNGYSNNRSSLLMFCVAKGNGARGFNGYGEVFYDCLAVNNKAEGIYTYGGDIINCVVDGNGTTSTHAGIDLPYTRTSAIGCRVTNQTGIGIRTSATHLGLTLHNFVHTCSAGEFNSLAGALALGGDTISGTQGYVDRVNGDYNLTADATMRRVPVTLPE
ncbi:MAG: hypothetical protein RBR82_17350 [Pseudomonas sp.]|nr:hypothetical protein [Pseudomonas sp.]